MTTKAPEGQHTSTTEPTPAEQNYPKSEAYTWGEFAHLAIETGGYGDLTAIDPWTGQRFWVSDAAGSDNPYENLRRLIDAMEREGFLDAPTD